MLTVRVLGDLDVSRDGERVDLGGRRPRLVLALLACARGRIIDRERLADAIWDTDPPPSSSTQIAIHISALRKALGDDVIQTVDTGYRLVVDRIEIDSERAERLCAEARRAGDADGLRAALDLWRGPVLHGLQVPQLQAETVRLEELRLAAYEDWARLELERDQPAGLLDALSELLAEHPFREGLRARLMEALWRTGRRADALQQYAEARERLAADLGLEPGAELQDLQARILRGDAAAPASPVPSRANTPPRQLPRDVRGFTGRIDELRRLDDVHGSATLGTTVVLHGPGGSGKTSLAVHWGHRVADTFPDGQIFLDLSGHDARDPVPAAAAMYRLLRALDVPEAQIPESESARADSARRRLSGRRMLVVFDNARDSEQVRQLLLGDHAMVVVTSRSQLRGLAAREGAYRIAVPELPEEDAVDLLAKRLDDRAEVHTAVGRSALHRLAALCGRLPVALAIAAERANRYEQTSLAELNAELAGDGRALDVLTASESDPSTSVRAVIAWSCKGLADETIHQFRVLGLHPYPNCDLATAASLAGNEIRHTQRLLDRLVETHLLAEWRPGEYEMHDLVRAYAAELAQAMPHEERAAAFERMRAGYLHTMANARRSIGTPVLDLNPTPELPPRITLVAFSEPAAATTWVRSNRERVFAVLMNAADRGEHDVVCRLGPLTTWMFSSWASPHETAEVNEIVLRSAREIGDRFTEGLCIGKSGDIHWGAGRDAEAVECFERERVIHREVGHEVGELVASMFRAIIIGRLGRADESAEELERALADAVRLELPTGQFRNNLACAYLRASSFSRAVEVAQHAVQVNEAEEGKYHLANALDTLGWSHAAAGEYESAQAGFRRAIETFDQVVPQVEAVRSWMGLGWAQYEVGDVETAVCSWRQALAIIDDLEAPDGNIAVSAELRSWIAAADTGEAMDSPDYATMS